MAATVATAFYGLDQVGVTPTALHAYVYAYVDHVLHSRNAPLPDPGARVRDVTPQLNGAPTSSSKAKPQEFYGLVSSLCGGVVYFSPHRASFRFSHFTSALLRSFSRLKQFQGRTNAREMRAMTILLGLLAGATADVYMRTPQPPPLPLCCRSTTQRPEPLGVAVAHCLPMTGATLLRISQLVVRRPKNP